jgi:hypothetical protein
MPTPVGRGKLYGDAWRLSDALERYGYDIMALYLAFPGGQLAGLRFSRLV